MDRNIFVITLVILIVSIFIGFNFIYGPKMSELRHLEEIQNEEEEKKVLLDEISNFESKIALYRERWIPKGKEESELLNRVRDIAGESQVHVTALLPQSKDVGRREYRKFSIAVSLAGTYHQLGDFVSKVENEGTFMKIDRMILSTTVTESGLPLLCDVVLSVFSVP